MRIHVTHNREHDYYNSFTLCGGCTTLTMSRDSHYEPLQRILQYCTLQSKVSQLYQSDNSQRTHNVSYLTQIYHPSCPLLCWVDPCLHKEHSYLHFTKIMQVLEQFKLFGKSYHVRFVVALFSYVAGGIIFLCCHSTNRSLADSSKN
jgi:hypothetical protein